jgi:hypothetical protein
MHDRRDRPLADALDRYWDEVFRDAPTGPAPEALDPDLTATVERMHALNVAPTADPVFTSRLWADLMHARGITGDLRLPPTVDTTAFDRPAPPRRPAHVGSSPTGRRWGFAQFAAAVLVLLVLGLLYVVFGPGRGDDGQPAGIPAPTVPAPTPRPGVPSEGTLLAVTVPAADVPATTGLAAGLTYVTILPGDRSAWIGNCCPGLRANYMLAGTLAVRPAGPMQVVRAGGSGTPETVPVGTEVLLGPGDAMIARNEVPFDAANPGSTPVQMLMIDVTTQQNDVPAGWTLSAFSGALGFAVPPGPVVLRLERAHLDPGADPPSRPDAAALMVVALQDNASGTPVASALASRGGSPVLDPPFRGSDRAADVYVLTLWPAGGAAGTAVVGSPTP